MTHVQLAAILFCDLVGSTEVLVRVGDERYDELRRDFDRQVDTAVVDHGGRIVKGLGDGAMATFVTPSQAVAAAVAIQRASRPPPSPLEYLMGRVRIGISAGEVSEESGDLHGTPVVEAARLCAAAAPGQVLVGEGAALLTRRSEHELRAAGEVELKGLPEPMPVFEVVWQTESLTAPTVALPGALAVSSAFPFVARSAEWKTLAAAWAAVARGGRHLVLVGGETGVGKTRIVSEFARSMHEDGAVVLFGACDEDGGLPFQPFVEALEHLLTQATRLGLEPAASDPDGLLSRFLSQPSHEPSASPASGVPQVVHAGDVDRHRLFQAVTDALVEAGQVAPVLLLLDDLHWAGRPTMQLVLHLMRSPAPLRLCLIATYRTTPDDIGAGLRETLPDLHRIEGTTRVVVRGLDRDAISAFLQAASGAALDPMLAQMADLMARQTDGNPFLMCELWRHFIETGDVVSDDGRWRVVRPVTTAGSPDAVRSVVGKRVDRLPEPVRRVLDVASVVGASFSLDVLAAAMGQDRPDTLDLLEPAQANGMIETTSPGSFRFAHALVWRAVYDRLPESRRARMHLSVAGAIARLGPAQRSLPELARHHLAALPVADPDVVLAVTARAARAAIISLAFEDAVELLDHVLHLAHDPARRAELLLLAADAENRSGNMLGAFERLREATALGRQAGRHDLVVTAALEFEATCWRFAIGHEEAEQLMRDALPLVKDEGTAIRALAARGRALSMCGRAEEADAAIEEAIRRSGERSDEAQLTFALSTWFNLPWRPERYRLMLERAYELRALAARYSTEAEAMDAQHFLLDSLALNGELTEFEREVAAYRRMAERSQIAFNLYDISVVGSMAAMLRGRFNEAEALAVAAHRMAGGLVGLDSSGPFSVQMFSLRREQGRLPEVRPVVELVASEGSDAGAWRPGLAALYAELGLLDRAREQLHVQVNRGMTTLPRDATFVASLSYLADAAVATGDESSARELYAALDPYRGSMVIFGALVACYGSADRYLGSLAELLGRSRDAEEHFLRAIEQERMGNATTWLAHSQYRYAAFLARQGRQTGPARAIALLREVIEATEVVGMAALRDRARTLLADLVGSAASSDAATIDGPPPGRSTPALSERELEVLRCLAEGLSNADIGRRLLISQHTAANHIRSILMKTGCANRTEVAAWAVRGGLVGP
jgi:predicted ATPase/class 3 adenylate cyclase/DNA-binding CsgD family transcriptional regulator